MEYLAPIVNFLVVLFIVVYFGRKPFSDFLISRSDLISNQIRDAETKAKESSAQLSTWESKWRNAQAEATRQLEDAKNALARQKDEVLKGANHEAERIQKEATMVAGNEAQRIVDQLQTELVSKSLHTVSDYFSSKLDMVPKEKLVSEFVELVPNGSAR